MEGDYITAPRYSSGVVNLTGSTASKGIIIRETHTIALAMLSHNSATQETAGL